MNDKLLFFGASGFVFAIGALLMKLFDDEYGICEPNDLLWLLGLAIAVFGMIIFVFAIINACMK